MEVESVINGTSAEETLSLEEFKDFIVPQPSIKKVIESLVHSCRCKETRCQVNSCQKMKRVVQHTKVCKKKTKGDCAICKQLIAVCCHHVKTCEDLECQVTFCASIKKKLKQQEIQHKMQEEKAQRGLMLAMEMHMLHLNIDCASSSTSEKDWRQNTSPNIRHDIIMKLAQAMSHIPVTNLQGAEKDNLISRARQQENSIFERASCRSEYYIELANMVYESAKETEEKRTEIGI